jgi:hypothetical protein
LLPKLLDGPKFRALPFLGSQMSSDGTTLRWLLCAQLIAVAAYCDPAQALQGSVAFTPRTNAHSFVVEIQGRKGTRNYGSDGVEVTTESKGSTDSSAETPEARQERLEQCMASWDSKTHITKDNWRKICVRQLSAY